MSAPRVLVRCASLLLAAALLAGCEPPPVDTVQRGYRGTGMVQVYHPANVQAGEGLNAPPPPSTAATAPADGPKAGETYQNVKVLGQLSVAQFTATMVDMTAWVAPKQGCAYCHNVANLADDSLYTKVVARRMLQMTQHINADWKAHVANTGVTCYTCHRGNPVPANLWTRSPETERLVGLLGNKDGQNAPAPSVGLASLPNDPFTPFLQKGEEIRVQTATALPSGNATSIKDTEWTYGLMMHMSKSLGVNCTYCHNSRSWQSWEQSSPPRVTAWHGIRMARDLNTEYLGSLDGVFPQERLGPLGDVPKLNCATCHQGAYKPLYGADILQNHPGMTGVKAQVTSSSSTSPGAAPAQQEIYFALGSSALPAQAGRQVEQLVAALRAAPAATVALTGLHVELGATGLSNDALARERAQAVRQALLDAGIEAQRIVLQ